MSFSAITWSFCLEEEGPDHGKNKASFWGSPPPICHAHVRVAMPMSPWWQHFPTPKDTAHTATRRDSPHPCGPRVPQPYHLEESSNGTWTFCGGSEEWLRRADGAAAPVPLPPLERAVKRTMQDVRPSGVPNGSGGRWGMGWGKSAALRGSTKAVECLANGVSSNVRRCSECG